MYNGHDSTCPQTDCIVPRYINTDDPGTYYFPAGTALLPPGNVEHITHRLEDEERNADRQDDAEHVHGEFRPNRPSAAASDPTKKS